MTINDFADGLQLSLCIIRRPKSKRGDAKFCCYFEDSLVKDSSASPIISSAFGLGKSPKIAIRNYVAEIRGKILVLGGLGPDRKKFEVPCDLTA